MSFWEKRTLKYEYNYQRIKLYHYKKQEFIDQFCKWCDEEQVKYKITESNGTPSKGKNSVLEFLSQSEFDGVSMTDGDDLFYPTGILQIERHLNHHPGTDVLIVKPSDQVVDEPNDNCKQIGENKYAVCWGMNIVNLGYKYGPDKHDIFTVGHKSARNLGGHVYYSKKHQFFADAQQLERVCL